MFKTGNITGLFLALAVPQLTGLVGSLAMSTDDIWYRSLANSSLTPPDYVFGLLWPALYILMGIASYLVWRKGMDQWVVRRALSIYAIHLVLNGIWSWLFFAAKSPSLALLDITLLWLAILIAFIYFFRISRTAAYLLVPYLLWVSLATYLNYQIVILN